MLFLLDQYFVIYSMFLLLSGLWLYYSIMVLTSHIAHLQNFACKIIGNCLGWFVSANLISTINLNSRTYTCFKHFPAPLRTPYFKEVKHSNNFPFQALFHACRDIRNKFQTYSHNWSHQDNKRHVLSLAQHKATQLKFACNNIHRQVCCKKFYFQGHEKFCIVSRTFLHLV